MTPRTEAQARTNPCRGLVRTRRMADNAGIRFGPSACRSSGTSFPLTVPLLHSSPLPAPAIADTLTHLGELATAFEIEWLAECDSTNRVLMDAAAGDDDRMQVVVSNCQHAGRGRRGRQWQSWPGGSLTFSLRRRFGAGAPVPGGLSLVAGLAVANALDALGVPGITLKWPNDILHHNDKLGGILVELQSVRSHGRGHAMSAVIGIGINLRLPPHATIEGQTGVTDLASLMPVPPAPAVLLAAVLSELHRLLTTYEQAGFPALRDAWQQRNAHAGKVVRIHSETDSFDGLCIGVDDDGALLVDLNGRSQRVLAGDVSLRAVRGALT